MVPPVRASRTGELCGGRSPECFCGRLRALYELTGEVRPPPAGKPTTTAMTMAFSLLDPP
jgi:hypothetical protein